MLDVFLSCIPSCVLRQIPSLILELINCLSRLVRMLQGSACFSTPSDGYTCLLHTQSWYGCRKSKLRSSCLSGKHFTSWGIFQAQDFMWTCFYFSLIILTIRITGNMVILCLTLGRNAKLPLEAITSFYFPMVNARGIHCFFSSSSLIVVFAFSFSHCSHCMCTSYRVVFYCSFSVNFCNG